jgi:hypothetical protein
LAIKITCNECGNVIEVTEAIRKELETRILQDTQVKRQTEIQAFLDKQKQLEQQKRDEIEKIKSDASAKVNKVEIDNLRKEYDAQINATKAEVQVRKTLDQELHKRMLDLLKQLMVE